MRRLKAWAKSAAKVAAAYLVIMGGVGAARLAWWAFTPNAAAQNASQPQSEHSRYHLVAGKYTEGVASETSATGMRAVERDGVFRIDTQTGRAWLFARHPSDVNDDVSVEFWSEIDETAPSSQR